MRYVKFGETYLVRLELDEEIVGAITEFANGERIDVGAVTAIGAAHDVVLGYYDLPAQQYIRRTITEDMEILSLVGNIAIKDGRAFPHLHVTLGGRDFQTVGGHLFEGKVGGTCEIVIRPLRGFAQRVKDERTGLFLLDV